MSDQSEQALIEKLGALPPERRAEVEDFVDFLRGRDEDRQLRQTTAQLSVASFAQVWDNADDEAYDRL
jgi:hypothetical protein